MREHARAIKDSRTPYEFGLQGPVSNSVVASILADIGFSLEDITGVSIPTDLTLSDSAGIGTAIAFGEVSMKDPSYGGISNTVSHVRSGNISGLTHAHIRASDELQIAKQQIKESSNQFKAGQTKGTKTQMHLPSIHLTPSLKSLLTRSLDSMHQKVTLLLQANMPSLHYKALLGLTLHQQIKEGAKTCPSRITTLSFI